MKDPNASAQRWATNLAGATQAITDGVNRVTVAPGQKAAAQKSVYIANVQSSADKWARNVAGVTLQTWQQDMVNKGIPRIATGATQAQPKMASFLNHFLPFLDQGVKQLPARGPLQTNIQRMVAMVNYTAGYKRPAGG